LDEVSILSYAAGADEDSIMEAALEAGADDVVTNDDGSVDVLTSPDDYAAVVDAMRAADVAPEVSEVTMRAENLTTVDVETGEKIMRMIDVLEDLDDVSEVYSNADIPDEVLEALD